MADSQATSSGRSSRFIKGSQLPKPANVEGEGFLAILLHPLSTLLICVPFAVASWWLRWGDSLTFTLTFFAMVPLAKILGDATEELAAGLKNDMLAGLLNATFGNAVEMVMTVQTLRADLFDVVKATLLGSVLSNVLLVLGMSFFFGGIVNVAKKKFAKLPTTDPRNSPRGTRQTTSKALTASQSPVDDEKEEAAAVFETEKVQHFGVLGALVNTSMLLLSCLSFGLVTVFHEVAFTQGTNFLESTMLPVSRICSIIVALAYVMYVIFQLFTHRDAMQEEDEDGEEEEEPKLSIPGAIAVLFGVTMLVAFFSEILVEAIDGVTTKANISQHFIGIVLLPIVGNACEHAAAVRFAMQDKPGLSIGIAVGSSTQIALFVVPFSVLAGWCLDKEMDLNFGALNTTVMTLSVIVVLSMVVDGTSNWLQGYLLCAAYSVVAVLYWHLPNKLPEMQ
eukprot:gnl/TRDRNA2_/TRDRNA2_125508_c0_seq1.p1 gnl/TRDRNA2_/TRDRNA2_125508_c0~~gnl/TRDRNA2_/TRDRNA2_125508_c0_seq1.p1  ORF type:complete len:450 (-),score=80.45 gnl/TRDRNA2_/TRDRNA2_125508_c0_seq1:142-1491(-)